jgi:hypothetical protein
MRNSVDECLSNIITSTRVVGCLRIENHSVQNRRHLLQNEQFIPQPAVGIISSSV